MKSLSKASVQKVRNGPSTQLIQLRRKDEHHVRRAGIDATHVSARGPDDEVVDAVAVDVAGMRDGIARLVARCRAGDPEAVGAVEGGELNRGRKQR